MTFISLALVAMTGALGTMLVPLVMGLAAIPAYLLNRFNETLGGDDDEREGNT